MTTAKDNVCAHAEEMLPVFSFFVLTKGFFSYKDQFLSYV
jgi:hypothetical protein